jgi:hypothetical protein
MSDLSVRQKMSKLREDKTETSIKQPWREEKKNNGHLEKNVKTLTDCKDV